jgi:aspartate carbamoyltransferase regulatory subunit
MKIKDVLILENAFLMEDLYGLIRVIAPQVTFNVLKDGRFKKIKVKLPEKILSFNSLLSCPNKLCITNLDPEAKPKFQIIKVENEKFILKCEYCEREFEREEIIKTI